MKVTVTDFVNVRIGKASLNARTFQYLAPGTILEVDGKVYDGESFEGSTKWLKDEAGNYYWAGATNYDALMSPAPSPVPSTNTDPYSYWHLKNFGIQEIHQMGYLGEGVKVCIIDSGIASGHPGFDYSKITTKSFLNGTVGNIPDDNHGHGTKCAGIIASKGESIGVAPKVDLIAYKGYSFDQEDETDLILGLENIPLTTHVVSISYVFVDKDKLARLTTAIKRLVDANVIVVAAHGNQNTSPNALSSISGVISVGAVDENGEYKNLTCPQGDFTVLAPGANIWTTVKNANYGFDKGTSMAAPFVASICALIKQKDKTATASNIVEAINKQHTLSKDGLKKIIDAAIVTHY
ncbi:MAG: hypothetical protein K0R65_622 [Crocinitomicaceae bacterium]|jgi:subtilisin family serine protease|nr:hypothetical protein [Crocinitomicaceae bacterium]